MFRLFTIDLRRVLGHVRDIAERNESPSMLQAHFLLGILEIPNAARDILEDCGVEARDLSHRIRDQVMLRDLDDPVLERPYFGTELKIVWLQCHRSALRAGRFWIGTGHGLVSLIDCAVEKMKVVLDDAGLTTGDVHTRVASWGSVQVLPVADDGEREDPTFRPASPR